ncbi:hypothetical protein GGS26DRAFT_189442 [Hypomontagnella submonticulosa]|nr:hypothetical protein GGS26DRAFT_189442 [Hypomontagnella submonticulosa]
MDQKVPGVPSAVHWPLPGRPVPRAAQVRCSVMMYDATFIAFVLRNPERRTKTPNHWLGCKVFTGCLLPEINPFREPSISLPCIPVKTWPEYRHIAIYRKVGQRFQFLDSQEGHRILSRGWPCPHAICIFVVLLTYLHVYMDRSQYCVRMWIRVTIITCRRPAKDIHTWLVYAGLQLPCSTMIVHPFPVQSQSPTACGIYLVVFLLPLRGMLDLGMGMIDVNTDDYRRYALQR